MRKHLHTAAVVMMALLVAAAAPAAAADQKAIDRSSDKTPALELTGTFVDHIETVGDADGNWTQFEDDNGNVANVSGQTQDVDNPFTLDPAKIERPGATNRTTLNASAWSTSGLNVSSATGDVHGVTVDAQLGSTENASATLTEVSKTTDVSKRVVWVAVDVQTLNGTAAIVFEDGTGDEKRVHLNSSKSTTTTDVLADGTGSFVIQQKFSALATEGSGDGTFDAVETVSIVAAGGEVSLTVTELSVDRLSKVSYGDHMADTDGDGSLEESTMYEPTGTYSIGGLDSLSTTFDNATVYDYEVAYKQYGQNVKYEWNDELAEEYQYDTALDAYWTFSFPSAQDVDLQNAKLTDTVALPTSRLLTAEYIEGAGNKTYEELSDSTAWSDISQSYVDAGDNSTVTIDSSFQDGVSYRVHQTWLYDDGEKSDVLTDTGGIGVPMVGGGIVSMILGPLGAIATAITGYVALFTGFFGRVWTRVVG
ncbi:hypothetical protein [Halobaculum sp. P14]|uniref:hypothetical protein n=1 Tax=Halobaculum sp. P14 TaxID=3421638 RepID=UPI003EB7CBD2